MDRSRMEEQEYATDSATEMTGIGCGCQEEARVMGTARKQIKDGSMSRSIMDRRRMDRIVTIIS